MEPKDPYRDTTKGKVKEQKRLTKYANKLRFGNQIIIKGYAFNKNYREEKTMKFGNQILIKGYAFNNKL